MEQHVSNICTKANRTLGFLRRNLSACPQAVKESAFKGLVRTVLWNIADQFGTLHVYRLLHDELEKIQKSETRFVTCNYIYETGCMTGIPDQLKWEYLEKEEI